MVTDPVVVVGDDEEGLLAKLIGRQVIGLAFVPQTDALMISFDAETAIYARVVDHKLQIEVEGPAIN